MTWRTVVLAAGSGLLLAACAGRPTRNLPPVPTASAGQAQAQRAAVLARHPQWSLEGRVGLSNGRNGGSGRIDWRQDGARFDVSLAAPITRQSWRLAGDGTSARLEGLEGGVREGPDAQALLANATGWVIPVAALADWVRGAASARLPAASMHFDAGGRLTRMAQGGWTIEYTDWQSDPRLGIELPRRLNASQGDARVRLVVDAWRDGPTPP
ncbi:MAG: lipoprotein insertase outer membrane protein LolB [Luteimonas sp.]